MNTSIKHIFCYLIWVITFTAISILVIQPEKITIGMILISFFISAVLSVFAMRYFFKASDMQMKNNEELNIDFLPKETLTIKANAYLKKIIMFSGVLFLTDKRLLFIGGEFFDKNKIFFNLPLDAIKESKLLKNNRLKIKDSFGKIYIISVREASDFYKRLGL